MVSDENYAQNNWNKCDAKGDGCDQQQEVQLLSPAKDTIQHIFWECKHSQQFWTRFLVLLKEKCTSCYRLRLSECLILFGIDDNIKTENVFDFILLLAKQYLYKCKIEKQLPNIDIFRKMLYRYKIEEYNAKMSCSCSSFSSRWEPYKPFFAG